MCFEIDRYTHIFIKQEFEMFCIGGRFLCCLEFFIIFVKNSGTNLSIISKNMFNPLWKRKGGNHTEI